MRLKDFSMKYEIFPLLEQRFPAEMQDIIPMLDSFMLARNGMRTCGSTVTSFVQWKKDEETGKEEWFIADDDLMKIATIVWLRNSKKWQVLFDFLNEGIQPWQEADSKSTTDYGRVVEEGNDGVDLYSRLDKIAGFDTEPYFNVLPTTAPVTAPVVDVTPYTFPATASIVNPNMLDDDSIEHKTTYGKKTKTENSGQNVITSTKRTQQAEKLVNNALDFWDRNSLVSKIISDTVNTLCLGVYESEDEFDESRTDKRYSEQYNDGSTGKE